MDVLEISKIISSKMDILEKNLENFRIDGPSTIDNMKENTFLFLKNNKLDKKLPKNVLVFTENLNQKYNFSTFIQVKNSRLAFAIALENFHKPSVNPSVCSTAKIHKSVKIPDNCVIGSFVIVNEGSKIGKNAIIESHCIIEKNSVIGKNTYLKSGAKIGIQGFGFERDSNNIPIRIWHHGGVIVGDNVEIGSNTIICSGTINPTMIASNTKIDDNVHVTHNCKIGERTMIAGCVSIGGSVCIGDDVWIGPNSSIINKISIGNRANIVIGSVVMRDIADDQIYMKNSRKT
jgi:UDP-3-O-[3-hydroxymyristoyl] glucosamine N-acyltransferase LpxD